MTSIKYTDGIACKVTDSQSESSQYLVGMFEKLWFLVSKIFKESKII